MARYIWTLFAGVVLGITIVWQFILHFKPARKIFIDGIAKALVDWIHGPEVRRPPLFAPGYRPTYPAREAYTRRTVNGMVDTHDETLEILKTMGDLVDEHGHFTVADLKTALGRETSFMDTKFGWKTVEGVIFFAKDDDHKPGYLLTTKKLAQAI